MAGSGPLAHCGPPWVRGTTSTTRTVAPLRMGVISGTHGTGKTTLAEALCAHLPGHVAADEPYYLLEEQGHEFGFPPALEDYRALLACSL